MTTKIFLLRLVILIAILIPIDLYVGSVLHNCFLKSENKITYALNGSGDDVLIFGSSRAECHYDPSVISDSLNLSCFNAGNNGRQLYYNYVQFKLVTDIHSPKIIIFDIFQSYMTDGIHGGINGLFPLYYKNDIAKETLDKMDATVKYKLLSRTYQYTQYTSAFMNDNIADNNKKGYNSLHRIMDEGSVRKPFAWLSTMDTTMLSVDKLLLIDDIINTCKEKNIELFFVASPMYSTIIDDDLIYYMEDYLPSKGAIFLNYLSYDKLMDPKYFQDPSHLNNDGVQIFTSAVISDINKRLSVH